MTTIPFLVNHVYDVDICFTNSSETLLHKLMFFGNMLDGLLPDVHPHQSKHCGAALRMKVFYCLV